jgi:hypothetical protein
VDQERDVAAGRAGVAGRLGDRPVRRVAVDDSGADTIPRPPAPVIPAGIAQLGRGYP